MNIDEATRNRMWHQAKENNARFDRRFNIVMAIVVALFILVPSLWACSQGAPDGPAPSDDLEEEYMGR